MDTLNTALMWRSLGVATIPILARSKSPALDKWKPFQSRLPSEFELRAWFSRPGYNIAVITGWQGLVIVDFDDWRKHQEWRLGNRATTTATIALTYYVDTPRGRHYYLYCHGVAAQCVKLDGVDIKAAGGYCLAPPSIHPNGKPYIEVGSPADIQRINSVADIFPEYQQAIEKPPPRSRVSTLDPLDAAMLPYTSTTIEGANGKFSWGGLLDSGIHRNPTHYFCPFHEDTNPSLKVYPDEHWYCFGCGASGRDKLDLYAQLNGMTIREALCTL